MDTSRPSDLARDAYLDRYNGATREHYVVILRLLFEWFERLGIEPIDSDRRTLEQFGRYLENDRGCAPSTVAGYLSIVRGFYKFAFIDDWIPKSPGEYLRIPRHFPDQAKRTWMNRQEYSAVLAVAKKSHVMEWALVSMLGLLGLRISEALNVQIDDFQRSERGHRVLYVIGKGRKAATIPLTPMVVRVMDEAAGGRTSGQLLLRPYNDKPMNRRSAALAITRLAKACGIEANITPHSFRRTYITEGFRAGVPLYAMQYGARHADPRQTLQYDLSERDHDAHANHAVSSHIAAAA